MPVLTDYRLFISHAWKYSEGYRRIIQFLDDAPYFRYKNYSVPEDRAFDNMSVTALKRELAQQVRPVHVVVILAGMYVSHSEWIQYEIDLATSLPKPILGILPWNSERTPSAVTNAATKIVGWNTSSIVSAIREITI